MLKITETEVFVDLFNLAVETTERYIEHQRVSEKDAQKQVAALMAAAETQDQKDQVKALEQALAKRFKK